MKRLLFLMLFLLPAAQAAERTVAELGAEFWFTPRHGDQIAERPDLGAAVVQLQAEPEAYLVLHYPQTESGELWGQELQAWLVSLGVVSDRIELQSDAEQLESVTVVLVTPNDEAEDNQPLQINARPDSDAPAADDEAVSAADEALPAVPVAGTDQPQTDQQPVAQQQQDQQTAAPPTVAPATENAAPETRQPTAAATSGEQAVDVQVETEKQ